MLIQEVKCNIIHKHMNITGRRDQPTPVVRIQAHLLSTLVKVRSFLAYQGILTNKNPIEFFGIMIQKLKNRIG